MGTKGSKDANRESQPRKVSSKKKKGCSKDLLNLDLFFMSRHEADEILADPPQKSGTFLIYEDADTRRTFLAFKSSSDAVEHHPITFHRDLYYLGSYPFPYLESIILYYRKHKLESTRLTEQTLLQIFKPMVGRGNLNLELLEEALGHQGWLKYQRLSSCAGRW